MYQYIGSSVVAFDDMLVYSPKGNNLSVLKIICTPIDGLRDIHIERLVADNFSDSRTAVRHHHIIFVDFFKKLF